MVFVVLASLIGLVVALIIVLLILRSVPFPVQQLTVADAQLGVDYSAHIANGFSARITNNSNMQATRISYRIDIYDDKGHPIDGAVLDLGISIPARSTRRVEASVSFTSLPDKGKWQWSGRIISAHRFYPGG